MAFGYQVQIFLIYDRIRKYCSLWEFLINPHPGLVSCGWKCLNNKVRNDGLIMAYVLPGAPCQFAADMSCFSACFSFTHFVSGDVRCETVGIPQQYWHSSRTVALGGL